MHGETVKHEYSYVLLCMCVYKGSSLYTNSQHIGIWSVAAWRPRRLCCRLAVFFRNLHLTALSFLRAIFRPAFQRL